ncbi:RHS repeat protein, partial [Listeria rocourtiae]
AYIFLEVEQNKDTGGTGTAWFDNVQLEKGEASATFNPVLNSSFETSTELMATGWWRGSTAGADKMAIDDTEGFADSSSARIVRTAVTDVDSKYGQEIVLNQTTAKNVTVTAMSKSENVVNTAGGEKLSNDYAILAEAVLSDGVTKSFYAPFPTGTNEWNRSAVTVNVDKPIARLKIWTLFRGKHTGKAWFDNMRVIDGEVLTENTYDSAGNYVVASYDEEKRKTSFTYDVYGNKLTETDEKGNKKKLEYNLDNQLMKTTLANGTALSYQYDDNGNATDKFVTADSKEQQHSYAYNSDNKITQFTDSEGQKTSYEYDANGNQIKIIKPSGDMIEDIYDSADRNAEIKWNGETVFSYQLDANGNETKVIDTKKDVTKENTYDIAERLVKQTERSGVVSWTYQNTVNNGVIGTSDKVSEVLVSQKDYQNKVSYGYNQLNQNVKVNDGKHNYLMDYEESGNVSSYTSGNGVVSNFSYDNTRKINEIQIGSKLGVSIFEENYTYDTVNRLVNIKSSQNRNTSYEYDTINQLTKENLPNGTIKTYAYDGFGNRIKVTDSKGLKDSKASYNSANQLVDWNGSQIIYDKNGNRLSDGRYIYQWNIADQLVSVKKVAESTPFVTYEYDDKDRRVTKTLHGEVTKYHYDGDTINVLYETDATGTLLRHYIYGAGNTRLAMKAGGKTLFYHHNSRGDVVAMTDEAGSVVAEYSYDAWGNVLESSELTEEAKQNTIGYAGYTYDKEIGMYYLIARYYEPEQGVFISSDPDSGDDDDPSSMNGYNYANNNPVTNIDPDGHFWMWILRGVWIGGKYVVKKSKKWVKKAPKKKPGDSLKFGSNTKKANKLANQMKSRGWTQASIKKLINKPYTTRKSTNKATGNSATVYYDKKGTYVIVDNRTKEIVQVSNRYDKKWQPDPSIINPYKPKK